MPKEMAAVKQLGLVCHSNDFRRKRSRLYWESLRQHMDGRATIVRGPTSVMEEPQRVGNEVERR